MSKGWSKGLTKNTNISIMKRSKTMREKGLDNFSRWRETMRATGQLISKYPKLNKNGDLAELIGVVLGDGHIRKFPRTEELSIFSNSKNKGFITRYSGLIKKIFNKEPSITKHGSGCTRIRIYQKNIKSRIDVPYSPRSLKKIKIQSWIFNKKTYILRYLRGLYEAEGSHCVHLPTSTFKLFFSNKNISMLNNVFKLLKKLGFHPHMAHGHNNVQISKKDEVLKAINMLKFRKY